MRNQALLKAAAFGFAILLVVVLYRVTLYEEDPCANYQGDVSGAVLADGEGDQDALVNRAMIMRGICEEEPE